VIVETLAEALERSHARLPDDAAGAERRRSALRAFTATGLPSTRTETWKYTDLGRLDVASFELLPPSPDTAALRRVSARLAAAELSGAGRGTSARLVVVDGHYAASLSRPAPAVVVAAAAAAAAAATAEAKANDDRPLAN
jgi:Fe-S cluster assembly protein SufD